MKTDTLEDVKRRIGNAFDRVYHAWKMGDPDKDRAERLWKICEMEKATLIGIVERAWPNG